MKISNLSLVFGLSLALGLVSCAQMQADWQASNCNREAAYQKGMNDGRGGAEMNSQYAASCPAEKNQEVMAGYREGYAAGIEATKKAVPSTMINVNLGGGSGQSEKAYFCETHAFTKRFASFGATEIEARESVKAKCASEYHEMHCDKATCRRNSP